MFSIKFDEYLLNPNMDKNMTAVMGIKAIRANLDNRYENLIKCRKFITKVYKDEESSTYYIHIKVPSESYKLYFDVVFQINYDESVDSSLLKKQSFKLFNNTPSFVYNYAYVYNQYDLLIPSLANTKYNKETLLREPSRKNPYKLISYEKSLYYAIIHLLDKYDTMKELDKVVIPYKAETLDLNVNSFEKLMRIYKQKKREEDLLRKHTISGALKDKLEKTKKAKERQEERLNSNYTNKKEEEKAKTTRAVHVKKKIARKGKVDNNLKTKEHTQNSFGKVGKESSFGSIKKKTGFKKIGKKR